MALTAKQISDLNNSNVAMQNASAGTILSRDNVVSGSVVPTSTREVVETGLTTVDNVVGSISGSPTLDHAFSVVTSGSVAGTVIINSYGFTSNSDPTPVESSGSWVAVSWVAVGD